MMRRYLMILLMLLVVGCGDDGDGESTTDAGGDDVSVDGDDAQVDTEGGAEDDALEDDGADDTSAPEDLVELDVVEFTVTHRDYGILMNPVPPFEMTTEQCVLINFVTELENEQQRADLFAVGATIQWSGTELQIEADAEGLPVTGPWCIDEPGSYFWEHPDPAILNLAQASHPPFGLEIEVSSP